MRVVAEVQGGEAGPANNAFTATGWDLLAEVVGREGAMPKLEGIALATRTGLRKLREACGKRGITLKIFDEGTDVGLGAPSDLWHSHSVF